MDFKVYYAIKVLKDRIDLEVLLDYQFILEPISIISLL